MAGDTDRLVGADRVLAVLAELARHPEGIGLDDLARELSSSKPTVHRALATLRRAGFATQVSRGVYQLGDEFLRLAFVHQAARPDTVRIEPALQELATRYGETAHFAVLDGTDVVYRAKVDPPTGSVRLTSDVGGRNPAYRTAVGKMLLSGFIDSEGALQKWLGDTPLVTRTPKSIDSLERLWTELALTRQRGYAVDDEENEVGINCVAVPLPASAGLRQAGAISISALAFRFPLSRLVTEVPRIRATVASAVAPHTVSEDIDQDLAHPSSLTEA
jgi:IclR family acetate operon transcriptional repressor